MNQPHQLARGRRRVWAAFSLAAKKYLLIDGTQSAAAFAHYAFFSLFPLIILFATINSLFLGRKHAGAAIIAFIETFVPIGEERRSYIFDIVASVIKTRGPAGLVAFVMLVWAAMNLFTTLIRATNRAWDSAPLAWWHRPGKSLVLLAFLVSAITLGVAVPLLAKMAMDWLAPADHFNAWFHGLVSWCTPLLAIFLGLSFFYRLAPGRPTSFAEVWMAALCTTVLLRATESLFAIYLEHFATLNEVYGAFAGIIALLLWIYLSGCIFIFGACLCAAQAEIGADETVSPALPAAGR